MSESCNPLRRDGVSGLRIPTGARTATVWAAATAAGLIALGGGVARADPSTAPTGDATQASGQPMTSAGSDTRYTVDQVDKAIGTNPLARFINYYKAEWGHAVPPTDPNAPSSIRAGWPPVPQTTPPMPFTDWPYGGTTLIGDNRTASVDSPLMVAIQHTDLGKAMGATGIQAYGWIDYGGNISSSKLKYGNSPAAYDYNPNNIQLDQAVMYVERTPDTVQSDHVDWGFRFSAIYGENYRYTTSYGVASYQLLKHNDFYGFDFPMVYGEIFVPKVMDGMMIRVGRFISVPDIEAQLAPNNYMYTHSITYTLDNYTNEGIIATVAVTKQTRLQLGLVEGTEAAVWNAGVKFKNLDPSPLYAGSTFLKDPGAQPSLTACGRWQSLDDKNDINICADAINRGQWGYNNLQWYGFTYYHTFDAHWHISSEVYSEHENGVPNARNPIAVNIFENGGTPFSPQYMPYNPPNLAQCKSDAVLRCNTYSVGAVFYLNYSPNPLDNFTLRGEYYDDMQGQRSGYAAIYHDVGIGWQHWLSPQIELRPEFTYYTGSKPSFDLGTQKTEKVFSGDIIWHF